LKPTSFEVSDLRKTEPLMKSDARFVRERNAGHDSADTARAQYREQVIIWARSNPRPTLAGVNVDCDFG